MNTDSSQHPGEATICDTTPVRYFAFTGRLDVLASACGGRILVPRQVWDPDEGVSLPTELLSEIGQSSRHFAARSTDPDAQDRWSALLALRLRNDIEVIDLTDDEAHVFADLTSRRRGREALGRGEAAVIAVAAGRGLAAGLDEGPARSILARRSPDTVIRPIRTILRWAIANRVLSSEEAQALNHEMRVKGYKGPSFIWAE